MNPYCWKIVPYTFINFLQIWECHKEFFLFMYNFKCDYVEQN